MTLTCQRCGGVVQIVNSIGSYESYECQNCGSTGGYDVDTGLKSGCLQG